jgi:hypothetical protein
MPAWHPDEEVALARAKPASVTPRAEIVKPTKSSECRLREQYKRVGIRAVAAAAPYKGGCANLAYAPVAARSGKTSPRETD